MRLEAAHPVDARTADARPPSYVMGGSRGDVFAHFRSGLIVRAGRARNRAYPSLRGAAPPTTVFYEIACQMADSGHVLDLGCGAGDGTRRLATRFDSVTGIDFSAEALTFAREWCPLARFIQADAREVIDSEVVSIAVIADLLGHIDRPEAALGRLRPRMAEGGTLLVAEPQANPLQRLASPARRAYSLRAIDALLTRSGFAVRDWVSTRGTFVACTAERSNAAGSEALVEAFGLIDAGDLPRALERLAQAQAAGPSSVALEACLGAARVRMAGGDGDGAARSLLEAAELDTGDARPVAGLAELSFLVGDAVNALRLGLDAVRIDPCEITAARVVAFAASALGHPDALNALRIASNLAPDDFDLARALAEASSPRGDNAMGIAALERVRAYGDDLGAAIHVELARLLLAQGRRADGQLEARLARAKYPDDPEVLELWTQLGGPARD